VLESDETYQYKLWQKYELMDVTTDYKDGYHALQYQNKNYLSNIVEELLL